MHEAILLGERGRISAPPNPWVASVIVDTEGEIIGSGYHQKAGEPHAEVLAVRDAVAKGNEAKLAGSTIYVTLEPCHHVGRTPPCDQLLISTKFARAVVALEDPDIRVRGQGVAALRAAGITVDVGVLASEARASLSSYLHHRANKRPYVVAKVAISIDGSLAFPSY
jgi:diaminohydroxyphosphoribosylaminopyrimidine deaminase/5-amino-6-(5-phosphoribosylamino)uracil reductase